MSTARRKPSIADVVKRVERLEDALSLTPLICAHPRGVPGRPLPEYDLDGRRLSWAERAMTVVYPGMPARPLRPGELEALQLKFGDRLKLPFVPKIGDAVRGARRPRHDDDDGDD